MSDRSTMSRSSSSSSISVIVPVHTTGKAGLLLTAQTTTTTTAALTPQSSPPKTKTARSHSTQTIIIPNRIPYLPSLLTLPRSTPHSFASLFFQSRESENLTRMIIPPHNPFFASSFPHLHLLQSMGKMLQKLPYQPYPLYYDKIRSSVNNSRRKVAEDSDPFSKAPSHNSKTQNLKTSWEQFDMTTTDYSYTKSPYLIHDYSNYMTLIDSIEFQPSERKGCNDVDQENMALKASPFEPKNTTPIAQPSSHLLITPSKPTPINPTHETVSLNTKPRFNDYKDVPNNIFDEGPDEVKKTIQSDATQQKIKSLALTSSNQGFRAKKSSLAVGNQLMGLGWVNLLRQPDQCVDIDDDLGVGKRIKQRETVRRNKKNCRSSKDRFLSKSKTTRNPSSPQPNQHTVIGENGSIGSQRRSNGNHSFYLLKATQHEPAHSNNIAFDPNRVLVHTIHNEPSKLDIDGETVQIPQLSEAEGGIEEDATSVYSVPDSSLRAFGSTNDGLSDQMSLIRMVAGHNNNSLTHLMRNASGQSSLTNDIDLISQFYDRQHHPLTPQYHQKWLKNNRMLSNRSAKLLVAKLRNSGNVHASSSSSSLSSLSPRIITEQPLLSSSASPALSSSSLTKSPKGFNASVYESQFGIQHHYIGTSLSSSSFSTSRSFNRHKLRSKLRRSEGVTKASDYKRKGDRRMSDLSTNSLETTNPMHHLHSSGKNPIIPIVQWMGKEAEENFFKGSVTEGRFDHLSNLCLNYSVNPIRLYDPNNSSDDDSLLALSLSGSAVGMEECSKDDVFHSSSTTPTPSNQQQINSTANLASPIDILSLPRIRVIELDIPKAHCLADLPLPLLALIGEFASTYDFNTDLDLSTGGRGVGNGNHHTDIIYDHNKNNNQNNTNKNSNHHTQNNNNNNYNNSTITSSAIETITSTLAPQHHMPPTSIYSHQDNPMSHYNTNFAASALRPSMGMNQCGCIFCGELELL